MRQTRLSSFIETIVNVLIGFWVALLSQILVFPFFDIEIPISSNLWIGAWFTLISIVRTFAVRRWFDAKIHKLSMQLAEDMKNKT